MVSYMHGLLDNSLSKFFASLLYSKILTFYPFHVLYFSHLVVSFLVLLTSPTSPLPERNSAFEGY